MQAPKRFNYKKHILVCCNSREQKDCCANNNGEEIYRKIKEHILINGLSNSIWVTRTRCLGFCNPNGANVVVYPEGKWYLELKLLDVKKFIEEEID